MGDGCIAFVPMQHAMGNFRISETFRGGSKFKVVKMKFKREESSKRTELGKSSESSKISVKEVVVENGDKDEVEEGEVGEFDDGEFVPEKPRRYGIKSEVEKGEFRKWEVEKGEFVPRKWRRGGGSSNKSEFESGRFRGSRKDDFDEPESWRGGRDEFGKNDRWRRDDDDDDDFPNRRGDNEKGEYGYWKGASDDIEKGEFISDRWRRNDGARDDNGHSRIRRNDRGWKGEKERTPPSGKYSGEKEFGSNRSQSAKRSARWEANSQDRNGRSISKFLDEEDQGLVKNEHSNGKGHGREFSVGNRFKRNASDLDGSDHKRHGEFNKFTPSKSRKISDDGSRPAYQEPAYRNSSSSRNTSSGKASSRHCESPLSSKVVYDRYNSSPHQPERSPRDWARHHDHRDHSPNRRDRSPYNRSRHIDHRNQSPSYSGRSSHDETRYHDWREQTPNYPDASPRSRVKPSNKRDANRKSGTERRKGHYESKDKGEKLNHHKDHSGRETQISAKESEDKSNMDDDGSMEENTNQPLQKAGQLFTPNMDCKRSPDVNPQAEEVLSMEEDMDICDTPPHVPVALDSARGKWFYLDHFGFEKGPSTLDDLKLLVEEGFLVSDHLVKHVDSRRWVTIENAASPLVTASYPSSISDAAMQLVSPPEASGNLLADAGDVVQFGDQLGVESDQTDKEMPACFSEQADDIAPVSESKQDLCIDERVEALFNGSTTVPGRELETIGEVLQMTFDHSGWERWAYVEGLIHPESFMTDLSCYPELPSNEVEESRSSGLAVAHNHILFSSDVTTDWFSGRWSCKGGDWKRIDETFQEKCWKRKVVLNDGYPLCQMPKSGLEDPRFPHKDELYQPSLSKRLDLPSWGFNSLDDSSSQAKNNVARGVRGTMLPVTRINTCVVKDQGSFVSDSRSKVRAKERYTSKSSRQFSVGSDSKRRSEDRFSHHHAKDVPRDNITPVSIPKDRVPTIDDLQLNVGGWYYLDGAGHDVGPMSYSELQVLADNGIVQKNSSVFRKFDKVWVPVTSTAQTSEPSRKFNMLKNATNSEIGSASSSFHSMHPHYIGYMRGKLHELIMKSYKSREFSAAISEVLDPWITLRQPRKELDHIYTTPFSNKSMISDQFRDSKRARVVVDGIEQEYDDEDLPAFQKHECRFDDLCSNNPFCNEDSGASDGSGSWDLLSSHVLARVFHFLRTDIISLVHASLTCRHWRAVVKVYKDITIQADLTSVASNCSDSMIHDIMNGYNKEKVTSLIIRGCTNITSSKLEEILRLLPSLSSVDIRGCSQLEELAFRFPNITWVKSQSSHSNVWSTKHMTQRNLVGSKTCDGRDNHVDDSNGLRDYLESRDKRDSANQLFRQSLYKRSKVFDTRRSSSILSRGAHLRHLAIKKSEKGYKMMKELLASGLKDIMQENNFEFFVPKVLEIEDRMKNGYYARRGLDSVKEDIRRMCRDAIKARNRGDSKGMNHIVSLFIRLATSLEETSKLTSFGKDEMKSWKEDSPPGFGSASSKYKKLNKASERKSKNRTNGSFGNCDTDNEYASDREIRRRLSKLNKKSMKSGSETSDGLDGSSEETETDIESSSSHSDSEMDGTRESRGRDSYFVADDGFDSAVDDREWGARMTKASLVPPVTRKYEVIDHYVIVADHEEVQRKMRVALPEDYEEKLIAQKNGTEESEIPEVKDYKPRKLVGDEVIEQEVYGIDPYTHNLLLDSMPDESDWSLSDKHMFIEDFLLRTLNRQARIFTGSGNTPMMYPLQPVLKEILKTAEEDNDTRTSGLCRFMLNAIGNRHEDSYVAYRKGLGVVCNKDTGFDEDDFVVEFLGEVYPAWKWFEKQDGIRSLQNSSEEAPEFYNINLERPKGDALGYDLVVVDAMHKANYASRICHSCRPNCEAKVTAVDGQYQIGIYSLRPIRFGEEITFDYNSVTESKEEYEAAVCLCGSHGCRGSYLNLTGEGAFQKVLQEFHGILNRHQLLLEACELNSVSEEDYDVIGKAGIGRCLLGDLPAWLVAYTARLVRYIRLERTKLPAVILKYNVQEKQKFFSEICMDTEKSDAEIQAEGVFSQRLYNLAVTLDKVRYVLRSNFGDPGKAPPLLEKLSPEEAVSYIWKGQGSFVQELIHCIAPYVEDGLLNELKTNIRAHDPSGSGDIERELQKSLIWLRDEIRNLPCAPRCRHDAAADLIHIYAHTKCFFRVREYGTVTSPPVYISPLDLGPKFKEKLGPGFHEYCKTYGKNYCLGQLMFWYNQFAEPDSALASASWGCLSLPDIGSFYDQKVSKDRAYGPRTVKSMLARMVKQPQEPWPTKQIWTFKRNPKFFGSPMFDAVLRDSPLDKDLVHWLKNRPPMFQGAWDG